MNDREPPGTIRHIPADVWNRAQATGQPIVVVIHDTDRPGIPWRRCLIPFAVAGAIALGAWGLVLALCALLDAATHAFTIIAGAAGPIGIGGLTLKLTRKH
ncbi:hypothetical protein [Streptomyces fulvorobeus]|uniref:Lipoprotein n=1 Tax=Streptomyces fulvorobeus TaxID=284028 RepID=A0A7J0C9B1_9ACTN|nr:hypothetical protein [Streptomyces fulvorobeus]NYE42380.1 hypothetical protein [Streptomyces fulvorobeus]GFM98777.1 hypothetical protein Sfulv_35880 [Streptomyces fulvorobeus]